MIVSQTYMYLLPESKHRRHFEHVMHDAVLHNIFKMPSMFGLRGGDSGLRHGHSKTGSFSVRPRFCPSEDKIYCTCIFYFLPGWIIYLLFATILGIFVKMFPKVVQQATYYLIYYRFSNLLRVFELINLVPSRYFCTGTLLEVQIVKWMASSLCAALAKSM